MNTTDQIIDAMLRLLETKRFDRISIQDIADEAGVSLSVLNATFASRGAILDGFVRRIDQEVLAASFEDMADQPPRERLFDVLMSRLDALGPHRAALKSLIRSAARDPALGLSLNAMAVRSQVWMLAAAGIDASGLRGSVAAQTLTAAFMRVLRVFVDEDDPGMPRTMAALDQELRRTESRHNRLARWLGPAIRTRKPTESATSDAAPEPAAVRRPVAEAEPQPHPHPHEPHPYEPERRAPEWVHAHADAANDETPSFTAAPSQTAMPFDDAAPLTEAIADAVPLDAPKPAQREAAPRPEAAREAAHDGAEGAGAPENRAAPREDGESDEADKPAS